MKGNMVKKTMKLQIVELKKLKGGWKVNCETHGIQKLIPIPNPTPRETGGVICEKCAGLRKSNPMKHTNQKKISKWRCKTCKDKGCLRKDHVRGQPRNQFCDTCPDCKGKGIPYRTLK